MVKSLAPPAAHLHTVRLTRPFYMGQIEFTQEQWQAVLGVNPSRFRNRHDSPFRPVEQVSWRDISQKLLPAIQQYAPKGMTFRLPTEAQWEYACRSGSTGPFSFGKNISAELVNYKANQSYGHGKQVGRYREETTPGGIFPCNRWGLHDMHGNVKEWCEDIYDVAFYKKSPLEDPVNRTSDKKRPLRVTRGGCWAEPPLSCHAAFRHPSSASFSVGGFFGFRLVLQF